MKTANLYMSGVFGAQITCEIRQRVGDSEDIFERASISPPYLDLERNTK